MAVIHPIVEIGEWDIEVAEGVSISRSLDRHASTFNLTSPDIDNPEAGEAGAIERLMSDKTLRISLNGEPVFTGYLDQIEVVSSPTRHNAQLNGRSLTQDLIDSSPPRIAEEESPPKTLSLRRIVERVNDGVGVVVMEPDIAALTVTNDQPETTERIAGYIDRMAQQRQLICTDNRFGELVILRVSPGSSLGRFEFGAKPLLSARAVINQARVFNEYIMVGEIPPDPDDDGQLELDAADGVTYRRNNKSNVFPNRVRRVRINAPVQMGPAAAQKWIDHEALRTIASAYVVEITVAGWTNENGDLYDTGQIYEIRHPHLYTSGTMELMVGSVTYNHSINGGQTCSMALSLPNAWVEGVVPLPLPDRESDAFQLINRVNETGSNPNTTGSQDAN